jgi:hypothetical protein
MSTELRCYCDWDTMDGKCEADAEVLTIVIDGKTYKIDSCESHTEGLIDSIERMTSHVAAASSSNGQVHTHAEARKWLRRKGYPVHTTGRVPEVLLREFREQVGPVA